MKDFLKKRWVRVVGLVPMAIYSVLATAAVWILISETLFRPPNLVLSGTDIIGMFGLAFFLAIIGGSGVYAIITAYFMKGIFKILYIAGIFAIIAAAAYLPLKIVFNAEVDFHPSIPNQGFLVGIWYDDYYKIELGPDNSYVLTRDYESVIGGGGTQYKGEWRLSRNKLHLTNLPSLWPGPWEVRTSDGYYFITYHIPDNPDAWSGYLGLMREKDWLALK